MVEAMGLGVPLVASGIPALRELDPSGSWARFFQPEDRQDLARQVLTSMREPDSASRGRHALTRFDSEYRSERIAVDMLSFFGRAAGL